MKKLLLVFSCLVFTFSISLGQSWKWGRQETFKRDSSAGSEGFCVTTDKKGNAIFTCGSFDTTYFGSTLVYSKYGAFCVVKYDINGNALWVNQCNSISTTSGVGYPGAGTTICTDILNNVYSCGIFEDTAIFGSTMLVDKAAQTCFLTKYDSKGNVKWAKQSVHPSKSCLGWANSVATDNIGNVYMCGSFHDTCSFGSSTLISNGYTEIFLAKYDSLGNLIWVRQSIGNTNGSDGIGLGTDGNGNIYMSGFFSDTAQFGAQTIKSVATDVFIIKYNPTGNLLWVKQSKAPSAACLINPAAMQVDKYGNSYIAGDFEDTLVFAKETLISHNTYPLGDLFIIKYDSSGNLVWAKQSNILDLNPWQIGAMALDTMGHVSISAFGGGCCNGINVEFGNSTLSKTYNYSITDGVSFVAEFDTSGKYLCGTCVAGCGDDENSIAVDPSGNYFYFGGDAGDTVMFGPNNIGLPNGMAELPFVARWEPCGITTETPNIINNAMVLTYPNPSKGIFNFQVQGTNQKANIEVYNMLGEKVHDSQYPISSTEYSLDLSSQSPGIYLYRIISEKGEAIASGKLVIEK